MFSNLLSITELDKNSLKVIYTSLQEDLALWLTIALAIILVPMYFVVKYKAPDKKESFLKLALGVIIGYAVTLTICISYFMIARLKVKGEIDRNFYLVVGFSIVCILYALSFLFTKLLSAKTFKLCNYIGLTVILAYAVVLFFLLPTTDEEYQPLSVSGMYIFSILLIILIAILTIIFGKSENNASPTKAISYAGTSIALSFALSYIKLFSLPQGGSITLASMLPLIIYSYVFGARKGVLAGVIYGILQCIQSPQIYQPMQVFLDYPIAFGALGVAGIVKNLKLIKKPLVKFIVGSSIACLLRYVAHVLSGYYVFSSWAMEGYTALSWGLVYNLFVVGELAIVLAVGSILFLSKAFVNQIENIK